MKIIEYHRPDQIDEALALLQRPIPRTLPLGGGTWLNQPGADPMAVVDLQALGLDQAQRTGQFLQLGATLKLQQLLDGIESGRLGLPVALGTALQHEATYNLRQAASLAGTLVSAGGRSPMATALLAMEADLHLLPGDQTVGLGDLLPLRSERLSGRLITRITVPGNTRLAYEYIARTPADQPIVCAALAIWPSGRVRLALGGYGASPVLALDGTEPQGIEIAAQSAYSLAGDQWASAAYRQEMAGVLALKCLEKLQD
jgi:CO/xanthine dehydrogenase FAD-binding subunit